MTMLLLVPSILANPFAHDDTIWGVDDQSNCNHPHLSEWTTVGYLTSLDGKGSVTRLHRQSRECVQCHMTEQQWLMEVDFDFSDTEDHEDTPAHVDDPV